MPEWKSIEGESPIDLSGLKQPGLIRNRRELASAEVSNINAAFLKYLASKPSRRSARFDYEWLLQLHGEMFGRVWRWAGIPRKHDLNLGIGYFQITEQTCALLGDLLSWTGHGHSLLNQAVWLHQRAVYIHPFENGNGRWARLLSNIWLKLNGEPVVGWPDHLLGGSSEVRGEYLAAIRQADGGDFTAFAELHRRFQGA